MILISFSTNFVGSYMDLKNVIQDGAPASNQKMAAPSASSLKSDSLFAKIEDGIKANPDKAKSVGAVYLYNITLNGKTVKQWSKWFLKEL